MVRVLPVLLSLGSPTLIFDGDSSFTPGSWVPATGFWNEKYIITMDTFNL